ncbi:hypothetical protein HZQ28_18080 [Elizabethkingia anophelis]|jgi:hypothetical protein|uniref:hypothetical protein n=1 Tax=Elizabethkingia meningoseptica TaxID=238 RepID=UPI001625BE71|nr:hypothetical protein [Elizabethkingia meningoseptica]MCT3649886.1 hypothetical protein [Elizabethkingia anophelis]MCT3697047.1 hypothetical protein [Elizabethkingia anophelis]MCT3861002.1 hypothetical protein [Elizabethkingia anophelis]MCT3946791.1 hypothetical protein [Elizabethkingia anophelis]MCT3996397.1 hypothetical protein [Elizabethkingia anophelis]
MKSNVLQIDTQLSRLINFFNENETLCLVIIIILGVVFLIKMLSYYINQIENDNKAVSLLKKQGKVIYQGSLYFFNADSLWSTSANQVSGFFYEEEDKFIKIDGSCYYKNALRQTDLTIV